MKSPAEETLDRHLRSARFRAGAERGRWAVIEYAFPSLYVRIRARDPESGQEFTREFHCECTNYPATGPFVERWDSVTGQRPPPPSSGSPGYIDALKDWSQNGSEHGGIYRGWQRHAAEHNEWARKKPHEAWHREREITFIMERLHDLVLEQACWLAARPAA